MPLRGLSPSFEKATAGIIMRRKGVSRRKRRKIAIDIGRKYMFTPRIPGVEPADRQGLR
jgi:hypothetical protein